MLKFLSGPKGVDAIDFHAIGYRFPIKRIFGATLGLIFVGVITTKRPVMIPPNAAEDLKAAFDAGFDCKYDTAAESHAAGVLAGRSERQSEIIAAIHKHRQYDPSSDREESFQDGITAALMAANASATPHTLAEGNQP